MAKLKKFLLRYYPPGVILEYESEGQLLQKSIDLLDLTPEDDVEVVLNHVMRQVTLLRSLQLLGAGTQQNFPTKPPFQIDAWGVGRGWCSPPPAQHSILVPAQMNYRRNRNAEVFVGGWVPPPPQES
jgi:hypothetical protein